MLGVLYGKYFLCAQEKNLKIPHCQSVYELRGVVVYERLSKGIDHYRAFFRSSKDPMKWFHANDSIVSEVYEYAILSNK